MRDPEVVASIVAGDPHGLATAYDRYADPLFRYCRTLLSDPADAADAVQDTFVIAASRLDGLRDPERLRAWLYAVARNESLRILRAKKGTSALDEAPDVTDDSADVSEHAERAELKTLFEQAAGGLNPTEREVIELQLRQGLQAGEVASVLGVSRNHAHSLLSRARDQLEACLAVLLVSRAGRDECGDLKSMLAGWDGRLTVLLRKRVHRHIEHCTTCAARRAFELRPAMLLDLSPGAALTAGAAASFRLAAGAPSALKQHTLSLATGHGPLTSAHSATVLARAGTFGKGGFPKPVHAGLAGHGVGGVKALRSSPQGQAAVAAAAVAAVAIAAVAFALTGNQGHLPPSAGPKPPAPVAPPSSSVPAAATTAPPKPSPKPPSSAPAPAVIPTSPKARPTPAPTTPAPAPPSPTTARPTPPPTTPAPAPATTPASTPPAPSPSPTTASPTPPPPPPPPTLTGTVSLTPTGGALLVVPGLVGTLVDVRLTGGTVTWSATVSGDPGHLVTVSPAAGTLTAASPVALVTITISQFVNCGPGLGNGPAPPCPTITFSPGGAAFSVWTGFTLPLPLTSPGPPVAPVAPPTPPVVPPPVVPPPVAPVPSSPVGRLGTPN